jgi:transposase InsO family protein
MIGYLNLAMHSLMGRFKSRARLEAENVVLRHQLNVLRRTARSRTRVGTFDGLILVWLSRLCPSVLTAIAIVKPETVVRWHRNGFRLYWRWKSRSRGGRPRLPAEIRRLVREMSLANPLWGAPRIHGELLKVGIEIAQSTVAKYMVKGARPSSQNWTTFIRNHASGIAAMDLLVVPTIGFQLLYVLVILKHHRRRLASVNVTGHPTAEWVARQIIDAFPWDDSPQYMLRDRDAIYGDAAIRRLRAMGIRDRPTAPRSPWQNGYVERLIGSIRRECLDHMIVFGEAHLRRILRAYMTYYNEARTHLSLGEDAPIHRPIQRFGMIVSAPILGGLHHQYCRI